METTREQLLAIRAAEPRLSAVQLAAKLGVSRARVYQILKALDIPRRRYTCRPKPEPAAEVSA